jgi:putative tryptophan/tyrosine transport system substrate-binding protein
MRRRDFIGVIYGTAATLPFGAAAEQLGKVWRIGNVLPFAPERPGSQLAQTLQQSLADLGDIEGRNIVLLTRFAGPQLDRIREAVISVASQADLLVVWGPIAALAAKNFAGDVPTVFISVSFPVEIGLVQSLAHPGGRMTGMAAEASAETYGKRVQILKEIVPDINRVAVLRPVGDPNIEFDMKSLELAARELGVTILPVDLRSADDLEAAFASMKESGAEALIVIRSALASAVAERIADLALAARLPSCHAISSMVTAGGLLVGLAPALADMVRPAAAQIDKIIKGMSPADIPVEQPTRLELSINLNTARLLNLTIPPALLARADEVIE